MILWNHLSLKEGGNNQHTSLLLSLNVRIFEDMFIVSALQQDTLYSTVYYHVLRIFSRPHREGLRR